MDSYKIIWKNPAKKEVRKLEKKDRLAVLSAIESLAINPRNTGVKKLVGSENSYRLRVGHFRVVFKLIDDILTVEIVRVKHRKDVYR